MTRPTVRRDERSQPDVADLDTGTDPEVPALVPSRRQYLDLKAQHPHAILLYRLGDFYETFDEDARVAARDARITLTSRSFGRSGRVPMAGIPHHALSHYLGRLLGAGHTVAIAEQVGEVGRGLVERAVTRVLSPGTVAEPALLPASENRYLAAVAPFGDRIGLAWLDASTGEFATMELGGVMVTTRLDEELARLNPAEVLVPDDLDETAPGLPSFGHRTRLERWHFQPARAEDALCGHYGTKTLVPYGCADLPAATGAAGAILAYLTRTNPRLLLVLTGLRTERAGRHVGLDAATRRNLELTRGLKTGGSRGSLLGVLDQTRTAMGARALRQLVGQPLRDLDELHRRQAIVAALVGDGSTRAAVGAVLDELGDLERLVGRVGSGQPGLRDVLALGAALRIVPVLADRLRETSVAALSEVAEELDPCRDVLVRIEHAVAEEEDGGACFRPGFCLDLDAAVAGVRDTRHWLAGLERVERERTGIRSLKVGFNKVFGYYIEVTRSNLPLVPSDYLRKQTVAGGERYVTAPLKEAEARVLAADEEIGSLQRTALSRLAVEIAEDADRLSATARLLARLDALRSLAEVAARDGWVAPVLDDGEGLTIVGGRHPVVEAGLAGEAFIANDCRLGGPDPRLLVVTGPNMGGKSTYLRQVAVTVLLAQIGSFVPAGAARIGLVDRIFTRVGAADDLAGGQSTFMVEMVETATILHQATRRSLVILDEIGRGTSTDDGLAIARAVLEDLHGRIGARTLFATHYLELTAVADGLASVGNVHVAALDTGNRVIFLYAVRSGPADRAYGIQVARLAGLPPWVADRAARVLADLPVTRTATDLSSLAEGVGQTGVAETTTPYTTDRQLALDGFAPSLRPADRLARDLRALDPHTLTPGQAVDWVLDQWSRLSGDAPAADR